jgi:hypothetical protein
MSSRFKSDLPHLLPDPEPFWNKTRDVRCSYRVFEANPEHKVNSPPQDIIQFMGKVIIGTKDM